MGAMSEGWYDLCIQKYGRKINRVNGRLQVYLSSVKYKIT